MNTNGHKSNDGEWNATGSGKSSDRVAQALSELASEACGLRKSAIGDVLRVRSETNHDNASREDSKTILRERRERTRTQQRAQRAD